MHGRPQFLEVAKHVTVYARAPSHFSGLLAPGERPSFTFAIDFV